jgi:hypothetical protein
VGTPTVPDSLLQNIALIGGMILIVAIGLAVINFVRREVKGTAAREEDLLDQFREAYEAGEMDTAEFERVRQSLSRRDAMPAAGHEPAPRPPAPPAVGAESAEGTGPEDAPPGPESAAAG